MIDAIKGKGCAVLLFCLILSPVCLSAAEISTAIRSDNPARVQAPVEKAPASVQGKTPAEQGQEAGEDQFDMETFRLGERLHRITFPWGMRNNLVVLSGPDGILLVDSGFMKQTVGALREKIGELAGGDIRFVINTHFNSDHVAGNEIAGSTGKVIGLGELGSPDLQPVLSRSPDPLRSRTGRELPAPYLLRFSGEDVKIVPYPGLHSRDDILIQFEKSGVVCMGDLLLSQNCPAVEDVAGYMEFLEKVIDVFPEGTVFVSGHGRDLTMAGLRKYRDDLKAMNAMVKKGVEAGRSAEEMKRSDLLKEFKPGYSFLEWLGPDWWIDQVSRSLRPNAGR